MAFPMVRSVRSSIQYCYWLLINRLVTLWQMLYPSRVPAPWIGISPAHSTWIELLLLVPHSATFSCHPFVCIPIASGQMVGKCTQTIRDWWMCLTARLFGGFKVTLSDYTVWKFAALSVEHGVTSRHSVPVRPCRFRPCFLLVLLANPLFLSPNCCPDTI